MEAVSTWAIISGVQLIPFIRITLNTIGILAGVGDMILGTIHMHIIHTTITHTITTLIIIILIIAIIHTIIIGTTHVIKITNLTSKTEIAIMVLEIAVYTAMEDVHPNQPWLIVI